MVLQMSPIKAVTLSKLLPKKHRTKSKLTIFSAPPWGISSSIDASAKQTAPKSLDKNKAKTQTWYKLGVVYLSQINENWDRNTIETYCLTRLEGNTRYDLILLKGLYHTVNVSCIQI